MFQTKKINLIGCIMLIFMGLSSSLKAITGAELSYRCLDSNKYVLTLGVYRACSDPIPANSQTLNYNSVSCGIGNSITIGLDSFIEVSGINPALYNQSSCNGGPHLGMELYVYSDTIIFPQACADWLISWTSCCRSNLITNLTTTGSPIYIEAGINSLGCYNAHIGSKIPYYCAADSTADNYFFQYDIYHEYYYDWYHNIDSTPIDSLIYEFVCPRQSVNNCLTHSSGLSAIQPFFTQPNGDIRLDSRTGTINFHTQPGVSQIASTAMTIYLMDGYDTVGFVQRDIPIVILDSICSSPIELTDVKIMAGAGLDSVTNTLHLCDNTASVIRMVLYNPDGGLININHGTNLSRIFGAANFVTILNNSSGGFRTDSVEVLLQILPRPRRFEDLCQEPIRIAFTDYAIPLSRQTVVEFNCLVNTVYATANQTVICPYNSHLLQLNTLVNEPDNVAGQGTYQWTQLSGTPVLFLNDTIPNPKVIVPAHVPNGPIQLQISHISALNPLTNFSCGAQTDIVTLVYDTSGTCSIPYPKAVEGLVLDDANQNCIADSTEQRHRNITIIAFDNGLDTFYYATDSASYYEAYLDTGTYIVHFINNNPFWIGCPDTQMVVVDNNYLLQTVDFVVDPIISCPKMEIDMTNIYFHSWCRENGLLITYANTGTVDEFNAFVDIEIDLGMTLTSNSLPIANQTNNIYRFNLDTVWYGSSDTFSVTITPNCQIPFGYFYSVQAHIYPDTLCDSLDRRIDIQQACYLDTARFTISNTSYLTAVALPYWIVENGTVVDTGTVQLGQGQTITINYPAVSGWGYCQLILDPYASDYIASLPVNCYSYYYYRNPLFTPNYQQDFIATYYNISGMPYDPNVKLANPEGYDSLHHYIFPNHAIDYTIHFQNTGTDTADVVVILDTLSNVLDVGTLEMKGSSHPYTWRIMPYTPAGLHVLEITFDQIKLPDSTINEPASHGFVKYKIQQQPNLPNFTRIENSASIYFDSNAPIKTNTAFHTVCDSCFTMNIMNSSVVVDNEVIEKEPTVELFPNPVDKNLTIRCEKEIQEITLYNALGQVVYCQVEVGKKQVLISTQKLDNGIYFASLWVNGQKINRIFQVSR